MSEAIPQILPRIDPADAQPIPPKAANALRLKYGDHADDPRLVPALRVFYATLVNETGTRIAPRCDFITGTGTEGLIALWPDEGDAVRRRLRAFASIWAQLAVFVGNCNDCFRRIYEGVFPAALRHAQGEYYTPEWLADLALDRAGISDRQSGDVRFCDPSCGSGVFLVRAAKRMIAVGRDPVQAIVGLDNNPLAVLTARVNLLACLGNAAATIEQPPFVFLHDAIRSENRFGRFSHVAGNPPWVLWDNLPADYRRETAQLWKRHGLFSLSAREARLGGGKKDLAMLFTYTAADGYLAAGGTLAFIINQGLLQSRRAGAGFRRFTIGDEPLEDSNRLRVASVDDLTASKPFDAAARPALIVMRKGERTRYPVDYAVWPAGGAKARGTERNLFARPRNPSDDTSPWEIIGSPDASRPRPEQAYVARTGVFTGGANSVFWVNVLEHRGPLALVRNIQAGKHEAMQVEAEIESHLLYPLLCWRDVRKWRAVPRQHIILVQDAATRQPIPPDELRRQAPRAYEYLARFKSVLRARRSGIVRAMMERTAPYAMFGVGPYSLSPWKVVWRRMTREFTAAVVGTMSLGGLPERPILPQETITFIPCEREQEAHYLCALLNSPQVLARARSCSVAGGKSFGTAGMLADMGIPKFDRENAIHRRLASLAKSASRAVAEGKGAEGFEGKATHLVEEITR